MATDRSALIRSMMLALLAASVLGGQPGHRSPRTNRAQDGGRLRGVVVAAGSASDFRPVAASTPIVEPEPTEPTPGEPLALPWVTSGYDPRAPGPVLSQAQGYIVTLEPMGRRACAPATHALLNRRPGDPEARAVAVLYRDSPDPNTNLDFHLGLAVTVVGVEALTPPSCRPVTWRLIGVRHVAPLEVPPGHK